MEDLTSRLFGVPTLARVVGEGRGRGRSAKQTIPKIAWRGRGIIANRLFSSTANGPVTNSGAVKELEENSRHYAQVAATNVSVVYHNIGKDNQVVTPYSVKLALFTALTNAAWQSYVSYKVPTWTGGSDSLKRSPAIAAEAFLESNQVALTGVKAGGLIMTRSWNVWASAPTVFQGTAGNKYLGDETRQAGTGLVDRILDGVSAPSNDWAGGYYSYDLGAGDIATPHLILGDSTDRKARILVLHDSIGTGSGDSDQGNQIYSGWPQKLLANYPWYFFGRDGLALNTMMDGGIQQTRALALVDIGGFSHVLCQLNTNDLTAGRTAAQIYAQMLTIKTYLETLPLKPRLIVSTPTPHTNSGNTAVTADYTERKALDALIRANNGVGYGFVDCKGAYAGGNINTSGLWDTTGGMGTFTDGFGIHPNKATTATIVSDNTPQLPTLFSTDHYAAAA